MIGESPDPQSPRAPVRRLIVVGCGPHFRARYLDVLESLVDVCGVVLAVDLQSEQARIREVFSRSAVKPIEFVFLPDETRVAPRISDLHATLSARAKSLQADGVMICTEPKAHKAFALWAVELGLPVFMDKPISAFASPGALDELEKDFSELLSARLKAGVRMVVACERRMHSGYRYVESFLKKMILEFRVPITYINIHFGGGVWMMPWEYATVENHPFKYGYGVLLHSGYHYVDLLARLAALNRVIRPIQMSRPRVLVNAAFARDSLDAAGMGLYEKLFSAEGVNSLLQSVDRGAMEHFGEVDVSAMGSYEADKKRCLDFSLQLIGTTVSARVDPLRSPGNPATYGRMRQENVHIHVANLCTVSVRSNPFSLLGGRPVDDFNIEIVMNPLIAKGVPLRRIDRSMLSGLDGERLPLKARLNTEAQQNMLRSFLAGHDAGSDISSHENSMVLLSALFREVSLKAR